MVRNIPQELKKHKEEFDFLHNRIGELVWDIATVRFGKRGIISEREMLESRLESYQESMRLLMEQLDVDIS